MIAWSLMFVACTKHVDDQGKTRVARVLPLPAGASEQLQESIRSASKPDLSVYLAVPESNEQWLSIYGERDKSNAESNRRKIEQFSGDVTRDEINGVNVHRIAPAQTGTANGGRLFVYLHGGAYVFGSGDAGIHEALLISSRLAIPVISIDYRMPPTHPFPAAIDDVVAVYSSLLESRPAKSIIVGGSSAGGGLALSAVHRFRELNLDMPGAIYAGAPWADLTQTGDTLFSNDGVDRLLATYTGRMDAAARLYAGDHEMRSPLISPVYGDFREFPPTILISGTRDLFLSHAVRTHRKLRAANVIADLHVYEGMSHAGYVSVPDTPESKNAFIEINAFIARHLE